MAEAGSARGSCSHRVAHSEPCFAAGNVREIEQLREKGVSVEVEDPEWGWRPLSLAASNGKARAVQALVAAGARVDAAPELEPHKTPLYLAVSHGHGAAAEALLAAGAHSSSTSAALNECHTTAAGGETRTTPEMCVEVERLLADAATKSIGEL